MSSQGPPGSIRYRLAAVASPDREPGAPGVPTGAGRRRPGGESAPEGEAGDRIALERRGATGGGRVSADDLGSDADPADDRSPWSPVGPGDGRTSDPHDAPPGVGPGEDVASHLRRRAAQRVSAAYGAVHGHPTQHAGFAGLDGHDDGRRRWSLTPRAAVAALLAVLILAGTVGVLAVRQAGRPVAVVAGIDPSGSGSAEAGGTVEGGPGAGSGDGADPDAGGADTAATEGDAASGPPGANDPESGATGIVVHVVGQVNAPGLVTVPTGARVADAVTAAGGATEGADLSGVNLARGVVDGEQIVVPMPGEVPVPAPGAPAATMGGAEDGTVDLNSADAAALDTLPGIGPVLAERIVAWRTDHGPFTSVEELGEVSGIGPAVLDKLRDRVRV